MFHKDALIIEKSKALFGEKRKDRFVIFLSFSPKPSTCTERIGSLKWRLYPPFLSTLPKFVCKQEQVFFSSPLVKLLKPNDRKYSPHFSPSRKTINHHVQILSSTVISISKFISIKKIKHSICYQITIEKQNLLDNQNTTDIFHKSWQWLK